MMRADNLIGLSLVGATHASAVVDQPGDACVAPPITHRSGYPLPSWGWSTTSSSTSRLAPQLGFGGSARDFLPRATAARRSR